MKRLKRKYHIVPLRGGFGNQLFGWAYGLSLSSTNPDARVFLDEGNDLGRGFALSGIEGNYSLIRLPSRFWRRAHQVAGALKLSRLPAAYFFEDQRKPPSADGQAKALTFHWGYWQSADHFHEIQDTVRSHLINWLGLVGQPVDPRCAIHVRRGDYVTDPGAAATLGAQPLGYYLEAINEMRSLGFGEFLVFTDDRAWAKAHLDVPGVSLAPAGSALADFKGMALCSGIVMSNSSYSWWAAFIASGRKVPVIAPHRWFSDPSLDSSRIAMDAWTKI